MVAVALALAALLMAPPAEVEPIAPPDQSAQEPLIATGWTLEKSAPKAKATTRSKAARTAKAGQQAKAKPRVFGGATANNRNGTKSHAKVGIALPF